MLLAEDSKNDFDFYGYAKQESFTSSDLRSGGTIPDF